MENLNDLYCAPSVVRVIKLKRVRWARHVAHMGERRGIYRIMVAHMGERRGIYRIMVGRPEGKGPLGRPRLEVGG